MLVNHFKTFRRKYLVCSPIFTIYSKRFLDILVVVCIPKILQKDTLLHSYTHCILYDLYCIYCIKMKFGDIQSRAERIFLLYCHCTNTIFHCAQMIINCMTYILIGILVGWLTPRPAILGSLEVRLWAPIKNKLPKSILKHFG